jgi:hypothetical protein
VDETFALLAKNILETKTMKNAIAPKKGRKKGGKKGGLVTGFKPFDPSAEEESYE